MNTNFKKQSGALLLVSIVIMGVLTLLGVVAAKGVMVSNKVSAYDIDKAAADMHAEHGLRYSQAFLAKKSRVSGDELILSEFREDCSGSVKALDQKVWTHIKQSGSDANWDWWNDATTYDNCFKGSTASTSLEIDNYQTMTENLDGTKISSQSPQYVIEHIRTLGESPEMLGSLNEEKRYQQFFRVTSTGTGITRDRADTNTVDEAARTVKQAVISVWDMHVEY